MALRTLVKVGEITNLSDARYCAGMGVDMLGFNLNPGSETYVSPEQFKEMTNWVSGVRLVGEFGDATPEFIEKALEQYELDMIQVQTSNYSTNTGLPLILEINDLQEVENISNPGEIEYFLLEHSAQFIDNLGYPVLLGNDLEVDEVLTIIESTSIRGIALKGSFEEKPGFKDYDQLADILEALETDD